MANFNMSEADLANLVDEVGKELATIAAAEANRLAKSDDEASAEASAPAEDAPPASATASEPPPSDGSAAPAPDASASAPAPDAGSAPADAAPAAEAPAEGGDQAAGPTFEELVSLYKQLPPEDLQAHLKAIQTAMAGDQGGEAAPAPSADAQPPAGPSAAPLAPEEPALKSENEALKLQLAEMKKSMEDLNGIVSTLNDAVAKPKRQAMTGIVYLPMHKNEPEVVATKQLADMTDAELKAELKKMTADSSLKKSERALINDFVLRHADRQTLAPLFTGRK